MFCYKYIYQRFITVCPTDFSDESTTGFATMPECPTAATQPIFHQAIFAKSGELDRTGTTCVRAAWWPRPLLWQRATLWPFVLGCINADRRDQKVIRSACPDPHDDHSRFFFFFLSCEEGDVSSSSSFLTILQIISESKYNSKYVVGSIVSILTRNVRSEHDLFTTERN